MSLQESFYHEVSQLSAEQIEETLRRILPPARLAMMMDGTLFRFSEHGANLFRIQTVLQEAGIPEDDPRTGMFIGLLGWLIDPDLPGRLHAIAQKQDTLMGHLGAVKTYDEHGRKAWWVPLSVSGAFEQCCLDWLAEFEQAREQVFLDPYVQVYQSSRERVLKSAQAAWEDLYRSGKILGRKEEYLDQAENIFITRFPTPAQIQSRIRLTVMPCQRPLPEELEWIYRKLQNLEREKEAAEIEEIRARTRREAVQLELVTADLTLKQSEQERMKTEQDIRDRLIREAVQGEVEQARQIVVQVQSRVIRLCQDILSKVQQGAPVSAATRRSWNKTFRELSALTPDHPHLLEALKSIQEISRDPQEANPESVAVASQMIGEALTQLEQKAAVTLNAEALWQLLQAGKAEEALIHLQEIRGQLTGKLDEVESLYELMTALGAQSDVAMGEEVETGVMA